MPQAKTAGPQKVYRQRHPEKTPFYAVLFHYFDRFVGEYDFRFEKLYGRWRPVTSEVVQKYLDCGMLKNRFARIRCQHCKNELPVGLQLQDQRILPFLFCQTVGPLGSIYAGESFTGSPASACGVFHPEDVPHLLSI